MDTVTSSATEGRPTMFRPPEVWANDLRGYRGVSVCRVPRPLHGVDVRTHMLPIRSGGIGGSCWVASGRGEIRAIYPQNREVSAPEAA